jgi:hypothetical protein
VFEKHRDKSPLPRLELLTAPVDGTLDKGSRGEFLRFQVSEVDLDTVGNALDFVDDGVREGKGVLPERFELLLDL